MKLIFLILLTSATAQAETQHFELMPVVWEENDRRIFLPRPKTYLSSFYWDGADQMVFRPLAEVFAFEKGGTSSVNVNAVDEVPNSSWFTNRMGTFAQRGLSAMSPQEVARGACTGPDLTAEGPWGVTDGKPDGANPGFFIKSKKTNKKYMIKFDGVEQGVRATTADVIGSRLYHAAGYFAPCNTIVYFDRKILTLDEEAEVKDEESGKPRKMTWKDVDTILAKSFRSKDGLYRASASEFLEGQPIGPFRYEGTREDDARDLILHEDRRELRGGYVIASWINHFDTREQNTLDTWIHKTVGNDEPGYVRHHYLDFGDSLGSLWDQEWISRRLGHSSYFDTQHILEDLFTLGIMQRPWDNPKFGPTGTVLGYYDVEKFVPDEWRPGYANPAFLKSTEADNAWMARILSRFTDEHIRAAMEPAKIEPPLVKKELFKILKGRLARIKERWFLKLSPLADPRVEPTADGKSAWLCFNDLASASGATRSPRRYWSTRYMGKNFELAKSKGIQKFNESGLCTHLTRIKGASASNPRYLIVDLWAADQGKPVTTGPLRVHLYHRGAQDYQLVGVERPEESDRPEN